MSLAANTKKSAENMPFLPFTRPFFSEESIAEVVACLKSGWVTTGPRIEQFEAGLAQYLGAPHVISTNAATSAFHLALKALNIGAGDEVIIPAMTWLSPVSMIVQTGARPIFVDSDPTTFNIDLKAVEAAITSKTKAIVPVHFAGLPVDLDSLIEIADRHGIQIIEDAAHAIGVTYKGRKIGSFKNLISVFSFQAAKTLSTGEGGCLVVHDDALAERVRSLRFHGVDRNIFDRFAKKGSFSYDVLEPGFKYNMTDIAASLGIHQLKELETNIKSRQRMAALYDEAFSGWDGVKIQAKPAYEHVTSSYIYPVLINQEAHGVSRDTFMSAMKEKNIGTGLHYLPVHLYQYYEKTFGYKRGDFPNAEYVGDHIVSIPLFIGMTDQDQQRVISTMKDILR